MDNKESLATWSLLLGIVGIVLTFVINILAFPIIVVGIVLGIINVVDGGKKFAGIVVGSIAFVFNILWSLIILTIIIFVLVYNVSTSHYKRFILNDTDNIPILGSYDCNFNNDDNYVVSVEFKKNNEFKWSKYDDEDNNHVYGIYNYTNNKLYLTGDEFVVNGIVQDSSYHANYDVSYNNELVLYNSNSNNKYYCKKNIYSE